MMVLVRPMLDTYMFTYLSFSYVFIWPLDITEPWPEPSEAWKDLVGNLLRCSVVSGRGSFPSCKENQPKATYRRQNISARYFVASAPLFLSVTTLYSPKWLLGAEEQAQWGNEQEQQWRAGHLAIGQMPEGPAHVWAARAAPPNGSLHWFILDFDAKNNFIYAATKTFDCPIVLF